MPDIADQYRTIAGSACWRQRTERGRLRFSGSDRLTFLQALLTNEVESLEPGRGTYAAYLTPQGRMIADLHLFVRRDHVLADVPASGAEALASTFDRLIFAEDAAVNDDSAKLAQFSVIGRSASECLSRALGVDATTLRALPVWSQLESGNAFVARTDDSNLDSFDVIAPVDESARIVDAFSAAGIENLSDELWTGLRIAAGRPLFGIDMNADTIPLEAGLLERAISTDKGCYVGQEVIIRVLHRGGGRVAHKLVTIKFDGVAPASLTPGTVLRSGDKDAGSITSAASALDGSGVLALGYVRREFAETGHRLSAAAIETSGVITGFAG